jgi:two-component system cell cycle response regulator DivK
LKTILVVDDQKMWRDRLKEMIVEAGHRALEAGCCDEALEAVGRCRPDLILLDYQMPAVSGAETARRIRSLEFCNSVPIIIVSGQNLPGGCRDTSIPHVDGILDKKDLRDKLLDCIRHYLTAA